jgi:NitT/TauT family transport system substrate-binding protein
MRQRHMSSRIAGMFLGIALCAAFVVPARAAEKIRVTVPAPSTAFAPLYHAQHARYFAEEGLDVEIVVSPGAASLQAVIARDAQFSVAPGTYQLMAHEKGQRLLSIMSILNRNVINTVMHRDIARARGITAQSSLEDRIRALKGLKVSGGTPGGFGHQVLIASLLKVGLDPQKDLDSVTLGTVPVLLAALEQRRVDAFTTGTPTPEGAVARGFGVMVVDNSAGEDPDFAEFMMDVLIATPDTVKQRPDLVRKVVRALLRSSTWVLEHPSEQALGFMRPVLERLDEAVILAGLQKTRLGIPRDGRITERAVTLTQDFLRRVGALKATIAYDQLVTNEFLPR